jgi:prepilin peptidase CpaA
VQTALMFAAIGILVIIAYGDVRTRRIPNVLAAAIATLGLIRMIIAGDPIGAIHTAGASAAVFAVAFLLFWGGVLGGGDAKLVAAIVLVIGYDHLFGFLLLMSVCGGAVALAVLARDNLALLYTRFLRFTKMPFATRILESLATPTRSTVPYGVAIAAAGVVTLMFETSSVK